MFFSRTTPYGCLITVTSWRYTWMNQIKCRAGMLLRFVHPCIKWMHSIISVKNTMKSHKLYIQVFPKLWHLYFHQSHVNGWYWLLLGAEGAITCSHSRSHYYFMESLLSMGCRFLAHPCSSWVRSSINWLNHWQWVTLIINRYECPSLALMCCKSTHQLVSYNLVPFWLRLHG